MRGTLRLQEWIHRMELGAGARYVRWFGVAIGFAMLALIYNSLCFRNFTNAEAMDAAQLGRNIARGHGYTTYFVRPLSIGLTRAARADKSALLREGHADISNPPVYPLALAGVLAVAPDPGDLLRIKGFNIFPPNLYIALFNQLLFALGAWLVFRLALRWFDRSVAWMSVLAFVLTELYWRFTVSGLSTILAMDLVLALVLALSRFEQGVRENGPERATLGRAALAGAVAGFLLLTRYAAGWLIVPTLIFVAACGAPRRWRRTAVTLGAFLVVAGPWVARTWMASGLPFGTATYSVIEGTPAFAGDTLPRTIEPTFAGLPGQTWTVFVSVLHKGIIGMRDIVLSDLPRLGGNWLWPFFMVGLLVRMQGPNAGRARWFVLGALVMLMPVQALTRTHLTMESPEVNSENLLVLLAPLVLVFGVGFFFVLFDSWPLPGPAWRLGALAGFMAVVTLPFALALLPPRPQVNSPPYYPPRLQQFARYLEPRELWMSDVPWAVAWYGERPSVWLTPNWRAAFFELNDFHQTVNGLYVSGRTTDAKFISNWFGGENQGWATFLLQTFVRREIPGGFPLKYAPEGLFANGELLLTDRDRWSDGADRGEEVKKD